MQTRLVQPSGTLGVQVWKAGNRPNLASEMRKIEIARRFQIPHFYGSLYLKIFRSSGEELDLGLASLRLVTDLGVAWLVDVLQGAPEPELMKFHGIGTGVTAEAAAQTALVTELTTEYLVNSTRATGDLGEVAANVFKTVGINTVDAAVALREHGVFNQAAAPGGVMIDRSLFAAVNLEANDSIQTDYRLTFAAGG